MKVTAVFDIGKTNKKFFLFDENYQQVFKQYANFKEIKDDDNFPCDDLIAIQNWVKDQLRGVLSNKDFEVKAVNFSTYGASFVHVDENGLPVAPLYNYLKPYPPNLLQSFYAKYGGEKKIALKTASPPSGMLNSGFQLYWLKYEKPNIFKKTKWSLHFPQYLSFLFSGKPISEYTSIGCHTGLWDYNKNDYHHWVYAEEIDKKLPPVVSTRTIFPEKTAENLPSFGTGIHDSSAALLPYILSNENPFLLISTGTWSISLNPFSTQMLSENDLEHDCLFYMRIDGKTVRASRLLLGSEYNFQIEKLASHFKKESGYDKLVKFNDAIFKNQQDYINVFRFEKIHSLENQPEKTNYAFFANYEEAYHRLMTELIQLQFESSERAIGDTHISTIYVDGGFADNEIYIKILAHYFQGYQFYITQLPLGSALGAAIVMSDKKIDPNFLKQHYALKQHYV